MSTTVKIDNKWKEFIDEVADQLNISRKAVVDGILEFFFSSKAELTEEEEE